MQGFSAAAAGSAVTTRRSAQRFIMWVTKPGMLYVRQLTLGPMKNFVYLIGAERAEEVAVIDPAWDVPAIFDAAATDGKRISAAVVSHHHSDHINGLPDLLARADVPVYVQKAEVDFAEVLREHAGALREVGP